ncbi:hypothetical protein NB723_002066 [Xanthomonas sacchari]|nr:hypothetical protein [Xanthomonas sacchari]
MCPSTSALPAWTMLPNSPGNSLATMRWLVTPASCCAPISVCAWITRRNWRCMLSMACSNWPTSSPPSMAMGLSSLPCDTACAVRMARRNGRVMARATIQPKAMQASAPSTPTIRPPTLAAIELSTAFCTVARKRASALWCIALRWVR